MSASAANTKAAELATSTGAKAAELATSAMVRVGCAGTCACRCARLLAQAAQQETAVSLCCARCDLARRLVCCLGCPGRLSAASLRRAAVSRGPRRGVMLGELGAGLSGGVFRPPERRPGGLAGALVRLRPQDHASERRFKSQKPVLPFWTPALSGGILKSCPNAVASGAAAGLTPPRSSRVGRLLLGRRARRAATHRRRRRQKQPGRTRGRERRAAALAAALGGLLVNSRRRQQRSARAATLGHSQQRAARGPERHRQG